MTRGRTVREAVGECCCGSVGLKAFEQGPRQGCEEFVNDGVVVDALFDHVGFDE